MGEYESPAPPRPPSLGGFLPLERVEPGHASPLHADALAVQSARAALLLLLRAIRPVRVRMPWYLCATVAEQARRAGARVVPYGLTARLAVPPGIELAPGDVLLVVNYFGLCDEHVDEALARFGAGRVIVDDSQAYFSAPRRSLGTIYSPRKFVGVADGGLLSTDVPIDEPTDVDDGTPQRMRPIVGRVADGPEPHHAAHRAVEHAFEGREPARMSALTAGLLAAIDHRRVAARRIANFDRLAAALAADNRWPIARRAAAVPMHYPFIPARPDAALRQRLKAHRIYTPNYWPHLAGDDALPRIERHLVEDCVALPCDQNCSADDIDRVVAVVRGRGDGDD